MTHNNRLGAVPIVRWALTACFVGSGASYGSSLEASRLDELPTVTIDAILERKVRSVRDVRWYDSEQLIVAFKEPVSGKTVTRLISIDGVLGTVLGERRLASLSPDGRMLLEYTDDGWVIRDLSAGETVLIEGPANEDRYFSYCCAPVWSLDGRYAAFVGRYRPARRQGTLEASEIVGVSVVDVGSQLARSEQSASRISIVDRAAPAEVQRIFIDDRPLSLNWAPDNALYVSQTSFFSDEPYTAVLQIKPGAEGVNEIYRSPGRYQSMTPAIHPDGDMIALVLDIDNRTWGDFQSILLIDATTGKELRRLTHELPILGGCYAWSLQGDEIYVQVRHGGLDQIYAIPLRGKPRQLTHGPRRHFNMNLSPNGDRLSYQTEDGYGRKDVRILNLATGEEKVVLVVDEPAKDFRLGEWQHIRWDSTDGVKPFGYLITPPDYDADRRYPLIVDVHGGGEGSRLYLNAPLTLGVAPGPLEWHAWAAMEYVVFIPDYRSPGDYGPKVIAARYEAGEIPAIKDIEDIVSGTRFVIDQGFVDPARVAILGHSAGGQRVYILLTQHDLYAAAVLHEATSPDPISNFIKYASGRYTGSYPAGIYRQYYGGELADVPDRYKANYMLDSYRNRTPTLIMLGNEALGGVAHMPNEVLYSILKEHGVPTRMLLFVEEGHTYSSPESAKLAFEEVRAWMETHMPNRRADSNRMAP